jgi:hypothetical protein
MFFDIQLLESEVHLIGLSVYQLRMENSAISVFSFTFVKYNVKFHAQKRYILETGAFVAW